MARSAYDPLFIQNDLATYKIRTIAFMIHTFFRPIAAVLALVSLMATTVSGQTNQVPDDIEYQALKDIYDSLGGSGWTNAPYWPTSPGWPLNAMPSYGIVIQNGDITGIHLQSCNLVGKIPSSISKLKKLQNVFMSGSKITGSIPSSIGNLPELKNLYLNSNQLTGSIPASLGNLSNLLVLHLSNNQLNGSIPPELNALVNLKDLIVSYNKLSGEIPDLSGLVNLTNLNLGTNSFTAGPIPLWIASLSKLMGLHLRSTNRTGSIPDVFGNMSTLTGLDLSYNQLTSAIPSVIGNLVNLGNLDLSFNKLTGIIPVSIGNLARLNYLYLQSNQLTGEIPVEIGNLPALSALSLNTNKLSGPLPSSIGGLTNLTYLSLNHNQLSGPIPSSIGNLTKLTYLYCHANQFTGELPASLNNLTKLQHLYVQINKLSGGIPNLGSLTSLTNLAMNDNSFTGSIPASFANLVKLSSINVSYNQLSGPIPDIFAAMPNLTLVIVGYNNFSGAFPSSIGNCTKVNHLRGEFTKIESLPASIMNLPLLNYVNFEGSEISSIPAIASHANKAAMTVNLRNTRLDFSKLETLFTSPGAHPFYSLSYSPQRVMTATAIHTPQEQNLIIESYPAGQHSTITWERLVNGSWSVVSGQSEDISLQTFTRTDATPDMAGTYRWRMTNSLVTGLTLQSGSIELVVTDALRDNPATPLYNGIISTMRWRTTKAYGVEGEDLTGMYVFDYDDKYQIKDASWATYTSTGYSFSGNKYRITGMDYDPNGNINVLRRYDKDALRTHNFAYTYEPNKNQLKSVSGYTNTYTYNAIGQMIGEDKVEEGKDQYVEYDVSGKVVKVFSSAAKLAADLKVEYFYDDRGFRLAKVNHQSKRTTWYIRDASGNVISIYEQEGIPSETNADSVTLTEVPIYGSGKLGTLYPQQDSSMNYEITDHLGNVRALLRDNINVYTATMEDNKQEALSNPRVEEMAYFENLFETEVTDPHMNHTAPRPGVESPDKAAYLFWNDTEGTLAEQKAIGPAIALKVNAGDKIEIETWTRYERKTNYAKDFDLIALSSLLGNSFVSAGGFEGYTMSQTASSLQGALTTAAYPNDGSDDTRPFAYLNYIVYDEQMEYQDAGWVRVINDAGFYPEESGLPDKKPVRIAMDSAITIPQNGYIYVWVSNQSKETKVWFDDLKVTHMQSLVAQATDFGIWGDVLREQKADESTYRFGYQGQFAEKDEETGWHHFELREYDPIIGRWTTIDPEGQYYSPYVGMGNDPVNGTDPTGGKKFDWYVNNTSGQLINFEGETGAKEGFTWVAPDGATTPMIRESLTLLFGFHNTIFKDGKEYLNWELYMDYQTWKQYAATISLYLPMSVDGAKTTRFKFDPTKVRNWKPTKLGIKKFDDMDLSKATGDQLVGYAKAFENLFKSGKVEALTSEQAVYLTHQLRRTGVNVRIDRPHMGSNPWQMPHLNVGEKGVHVPFKY